MPEVKSVMSFAEAVKYAGAYEKRLIPYELSGGMDQTRKIFDEIHRGESVAVFIGPEGGFEAQEIELAQAAGILPVTLGKRILRTETAGMTVLSVLMFRLEQ